MIIAPPEYHFSCHTPMLYITYGCRTGSVQAVGLHSYNGTDMALVLDVKQSHCLTDAVRYRKHTEIKEVFRQICV